MGWRSERIWIELITGSRKTSNFCWALILFLGSLGFLLVGTSSYLEGIVCIFRWGFPGKNRRIFLRFFMKDIQSIRIEVKEGIYTRRVLYMEIRGQGVIPLTRTDENLTPREIEQKAAELAYFLRVPIEVF
uniref:Photosystem I assembly protein Ycf4 n=1 Tax=Cajanus cajan TaxID=3821 RepID=A0A151R2D2_CAJCA|nr:Photosystem I assembly protein ycf4 [Cajanus cajan]